jgi:hypothetical protein
MLLPFESERISSAGLRFTILVNRKSGQSWVQDGLLFPETSDQLLGLFYPLLDLEKFGRNSSLIRQSNGKLLHITVQLVKKATVHQWRIYEININNTRREPGDQIAGSEEH